MIEEAQFNYIHPNLEKGVNDLSFDWYGKKLALVNDSRRIEIYALGPSGWGKETEFDSKHEGPIWRVKWAHPNYGNILATSWVTRLV
jgi:hypothetical protein